MWQIALSCLISLGMILGAQNYTSEHTKEQIKLGASQPISALTELTSLSHNDVFPITDTANAQTKKLKWGTATATLKTLFDAVYSPLFTTSAGLAGLLSDETGSSGGFVRAGSPTIDSVTLSTSANITAPTFDVAGTDATGDIWYRNSGGLFTRLAMPSLSGYYLTGSTTLGIPQWDNNILSNPYNGNAVFSGLVYAGNFIDRVSSTTINTSTGPVPVFIATSTNALVISEADVATTTDFLGFATSTNVTNGATGTVQISGIVNGFSGLTVGQPYYVSNTRGAISSTVGAAELYVGTAVSATQILLDRKDGYWQYLGSQTCTPPNTQNAQCDTASIPFARFAVFISSKNSSIGTTQITGTVARVGASTVTSIIPVTSASPALDTQSYSVTFTSTSSIRFVANSSAGASWTGQTQTAYFYR